MFQASADLELMEEFLVYANRLLVAVSATILCTTDFVPRLQLNFPNFTLATLSDEFDAS